MDGFALGHTPAALDLVPGTYQLLVGRPDAFSFPHLVQLREDTSLRVDLAFEQTIPPSRAACLQQPRDGKETPLGNALKLALLLEVDQLVVLRLDRPAGRTELALRGGPQRADRTAYPRRGHPARRGAGFVATTSASWRASSSPARRASGSWW